MDRADVSRCVETLADNAARAGRLTWTDVVRVATVRGLVEELPGIVAALDDLGIPVEGAPSSMATPHAQAARAAVGASPASMRSQLTLSPQQEIALGRRIRLGMAAAERAASEGRDPSPDENALIEDSNQARDELVVANVSLAVNLARRYLHRAGGRDLDDLVQEGIKGLHQAAMKFDPEKGHAFFTHATWWVRQHVVRALG